MREKGFGGFPTLAFLDANGDVLTSRVPRTVAGFRTVAAALATDAELAAALAKGTLDPDTSAKLLLAQVTLGKVDAEAFRTRADAITGTLSAANRKAIETQRVDFEVAAIFTKHQKGAQPGNDPSAMQDAVAKELEVLLAAGKVPSDQAAWRYWLFLRLSAQRRGDTAMERRATDEMRALAERDPSLRPMIDLMLQQKAGAGTRATSRPASRAEIK